MIKILLLLLIQSGRGDAVILDKLNYETGYLYSYSLPKGVHSHYSYIFTDVGGQGKTHVYEYQNGAILYISNGESMCPALESNHYCLTGDAIMREVYPKDYHLQFQGYLPDSGYYREEQSFDYCIGYFGVKKEDIKGFDKTIDGLLALEVCHLLTAL